MPSLIASFLANPDINNEDLIKFKVATELAQIKLLANLHSAKVVFIPFFRAFKISAGKTPF